VIFGNFGGKRVNCDEMDGDRPRLPANRNCYALARLMSIRSNCLFFETGQAKRAHWSLADAYVSVVTDAVRR